MFGKTLVLELWAKKCVGQVGQIGPKVQTLTDKLLIHYIIGLIENK